MGKLVFQATLGGQVNLVGPNTASTYDINVPAVAGNMVTTGDTGTVTNTMCATSVYTAPGTIGSGTPNSGSFTSLAYSTTLTGGTGVVNLGSGQFYKDASGNVGIGATPASFATAKALQLNTTGAIFSFTNELDVAQNVYYNAGNKYITTAAASLYSQSGGVHYWYNAPSGTAGNAITFTQAMTLDASGNLGIAVTSPAAKLDVLGDIFARASTLRFKDSGNTTQYGAIYGDSTSFHVNAGVNNLIFYSAGSERARIDSSGNLLVGTTSGTSKIVTTTTTTSCGFFTFDGSTGNGLNLKTTYASTGSLYLNFQNSAGSQTGYISQNGTTTVNYVTSSDARLKTNIVDADSAKTKIEAIKIRKFDWISGEHQDFGVVAQELFEVAPEAVSVGITEEQTWGVDYSKLVPSLIKYVQEQQALITQLQADVAALKAA